MALPVSWGLTEARAKYMGGVSEPSETPLFLRTSLDEPAPIQRRPSAGQAFDSINEEVLDNSLDEFS